MISSQDRIITYAGLTAIIYFLIRAFTEDALDNKQTLLLLVCIMVPVMFLCDQSLQTCPKKNAETYREHYQVTDPPVTASIYPGPPNQDPVLGKVQIPPALPAASDNLDIQDFKDTLPINRKIYAELVDNEEKAKNKIRSTFTNEMVFTESDPFNTIPLGTQMYGYTFLPPENWFRAYDRPPVCISDTRPLMEPIIDGNSTRDLLEFDTMSNIVTASAVTPRSVAKKLNQRKNRK